MANIENLSPEELKMQGLLGRYLVARVATERSVSAGADHLDDDTLSAFVEGSLSTREAKPIVSHLVDCSFCRHVTSELVRLDLAFADTAEIRQPIVEAEPSRISEVLNGILSRIFGTRDGAVFAHHEDDKEAEDSSDNAEKEKEDNEKK
jgi:hypothetical protein